MYLSAISCQYDMAAVKNVYCLNKQPFTFPRLFFLFIYIYIIDNPLMKRGIPKAAILIVSMDIYCIHTIDTKLPSPKLYHLFVSFGQIIVELHCRALLCRKLKMFNFRLLAFFTLLVNTAPFDIPP